MADDEEQDCCPLCMEELDITDTSFDACPCGYQVCLWCWHQIKNEYNALCPACRTPYAEISKQKNTLDREDVVRRTKQRKQKEKSDRRAAAAAQSSSAPTSSSSSSMSYAAVSSSQPHSQSSITSSSSRQAPVNRKSLANLRVMQRNLVYVIGLPQSFTSEEHLRSNACFGQYGKIVKAVVNKSHLTTDRSNATASAYITFANKDDALACIIAIDGYYLDNCMLRASFGTTKYCNYFLRHQECGNSDCLYLHELGDQDDSFTKEEMQAALQSGKAAFRESTAAAGGALDARGGDTFPPPYRPQSLSAAASVEYADAQRKAQSAAAIHKLKQSAHHRSDSSPPPSSRSRSSNGPPPMTPPPPLANNGHPQLHRAASMAAPYSKIVAGSASASTQPPVTATRTLPRSSSLSASMMMANTELTMAEKLANSLHNNSNTSRSADASPAPPRLTTLTRSRSATPPPPGVKLTTDETAQRPKLNVDTSSGARNERSSASTVTPKPQPQPAVVGPLEALKRATGTTAEAPAWAQPFPSPSIALQSQSDTDDSSFSPFTLGFAGGIHRSNGASHVERDHAWGNASAAFPDPTEASNGLRRSASGTSASVFGAGANTAPPSSSLSFASIDAIFSQRNSSSESPAPASDAFAGLLGVPLSAAASSPLPPPPRQPRSATPQSINARGSRFAFANAPSGGLDHHALGSASSLSPPPSASTSRHAPPSPFGYSAASAVGSNGSFAMHPHDTSAFPPLGATTPHNRPLHQSAPFHADFGASTSLHPQQHPQYPQQQQQTNDDMMMMGSGLAFLQQMLPNVNISFGGDYPTTTGADFGDSDAAPSAWSSAGLGSLGFDASSRPLAAASTSTMSSTSSGFYDPAIVSHSNALPSANLFGRSSSMHSGSMGGNGEGLDSESERHHLHSALGSGSPIYRHSSTMGSI